MPKVPRPESPPPSPPGPDLFPDRPPAVTHTVSLLPLDEVIFERDWPEPTPQFVEGVKRVGVLTPIAVRKEGDRYRVLLGRRRVQAAKLAGHHAIHATCYDVRGPVTAAIVTLIENLHRSANIPAELAAIEALQEKTGATPTQIAHALGVPVSTIHRRLKIRGLIKDLRDAFDKGTLAAKAAEKAATLAPAIQQKLAKRLKEDGRLTMTQVHEVRQARAVKAAIQLPEHVFTPEGPATLARQAKTAADMVDLRKRAISLVRAARAPDAKAIAWVVALAFDAGRLDSKRVYPTGADYASAALTALINQGES